MLGSALSDMSFFSIRSTAMRLKYRNDIRGGGDPWHKCKMKYMYNDLFYNTEHLGRLFLTNNCRMK